MATAPAPSPDVNVRIDSEAVLREARMAGFAMINSYMRQYQIIADYLEMKPAAAVVFLTILLAGGQRYIRRTPVPDEFRGITPLPRDEVIPISRRALAGATGLPRETVRRIVAELIASGDVTEVGRDGVISRFGELLSPRAQRVVELMGAEYVQTFETLSRLGVLVER